MAKRELDARPEKKETPTGHKQKKDGRCAAVEKAWSVRRSREIG